MTLREEVEAELGCTKTQSGKIGQRYYAALALGPSAWRKSMKYWAALWLGIVLGAIGAGVMAVFVGLVR
jgi:hypothetical protein